MAKLKLKDNGDLKLIMFSYRLVDAMPENFHTFVGYSIDELQATFNKRGIPGHIDIKGSILIKDLVAQLDLSDLGPAVTQPQQLDVPTSLSDITTSKDQFLQNLMLTADKFLQDASDKRKLKNLIGKIQKSPTKQIDARTEWKSDKLK